MADIHQRIALTTAALLEAARSAGMAISGDRRVSEADAATLLSASRDHLKRLRQCGDGPRCYRMAVNGSRVSYRVEDLASWIEVSEEGRTGVNGG